MSRLLRNLFGNVKKFPRRPKKTWLQVEDLEERALPTVVFSPFFGAETLNPTPNGDFNYETISSAQVNLLFWGKFWGTAAGTQQATALRGEAQLILSTNYFKPLTQYGSDGVVSFAGQLHRFFIGSVRKLQRPKPQLGP